jgi:subtilase family serine protease
VGFSGQSYAQGSDPDSRARWEGRPTVASRGTFEMRTHSWIRGDSIGPDSTPAASTTPGGLHPSGMIQAYRIDSIPGSNGGAGTTIAIVDAYDSPSAEADLQTFSSQFGLPSCTTASGCFAKVGATGSASNLPRRDTGWEVEINLDIQWAHTIAPNAHILLVEANSSRNTDLLAAVDYAKQHANVVSMSWGGSEFGGQTLSDSHFSWPGVIFVASSGDVGGVVSWPASSPNVVAVGATQLIVNATTGAISTESAWGSASTGRRGAAGSGGGCSTREQQPTYQTGVLPFAPSCANRAVPDVAMAGGDLSAVPVYVSRQGGWFNVYGTSLSAPMWAGLIAIADGMRPAGASLGAQPGLYAAGAAYFNDISQGNAGAFVSAAGWDFITGLGSPKADQLIPYLVQRVN